jgi:rhodanese-related sulfurtransferase
MGANNSKFKINYEDLQVACKYSYNSNNNNNNNNNDGGNNNNKNKYAIINTLDPIYQTCLIPNTIPIAEEEEIVNDIITNSKKTKIIIYGLNSNDEKVYSKYEQLVKLGVKHVYIYNGGMFEWLLLQDVYGRELFPTTSNELDILKYKPRKILDILFIKM